MSEIGGVRKHQNNPECTIKKEVWVLKMLKLNTMRLVEYGNTKITQNARGKKRNRSVENVEVGHYDYTKEGEVRWYNDRKKAKVTLE